MNILLLTFDYSPYSGGESKIGFQWATELSARGHNVTVITNLNNKKDIDLYNYDNKQFNITYEYVESPKILGISIFKKIYHPVVIESQLYQKEVAKRLEYLLTANQYDLIHQLSPTDIRVIGYGMNFGLPFFIGPLGGGQFVPNGLKYYIRKNKNVEYLRKMMTYLITRAPNYRSRIRKISKLIIVNPETEKYMNKAFKNISYEMMSDIGTVDNLKVQVNNNETESPIKFLWVGRLSYRKGLELLIDSLPFVKDKKNFHLTIIGEDVENLRSVYEDKIQELNCSHLVSFLGKMSYQEVQKKYIENDVFVFTSLRETGGNVLYEAAQYGLPIIMPNQNMAYLLKKYAVTYEVTNRQLAIEQLSKAINNFIDSNLLRSEYSGKSLEFARGNTFSKKVDRMLSIYEENIIKKK